MLSSYKLPAVIALSIALGACATIVDGIKGEDGKTIALKTDPPGARFTIEDKKGRTVARGTTPAQIAVEKGCGYFCGNDFKVKFELDGHEVHELNVLTTPSGWYVAGNIVFGFIVGWFIVDPLTGSMFTLEPNIASADLRPKSRQSGAEAPTLRLTTLDNVPEAALPFLKKVD